MFNPHQPWYHTRFCTTILLLLAAMVAHPLTAHADDSNYGKELVVNGDFTNEKTNWTAENGSYFTVFRSNTTPGIGTYLQTGVGGCTWYQDIDLTKSFTTEELDAGVKGYLSYDYFCNLYIRAQVVTVQCMTADGNVITETSHTKTSYSSQIKAPAPWLSYQAAVDIPNGTRIVRIQLFGKGGVNNQWETWTGPGFDNVSFKLEKATTEVETCDIDVETNIGNEYGLGDGTFWKGSIVYIATAHDESTHNCENTFTGYNGETNADATTTQRQITVTDNATYKALFTTATVQLSDSAYSYPYNYASYFNEPSLILPDGYDGTPTYESSNTALATVSNSGKVTYVGNGQIGTVTITITVPQTGSTKAQTVSYTITYLHKLDLTADPREGGTIVPLPGNGDENFQLVAYENDDYNFVRWTDDEGLTDKRDITLDSDQSYTAVFRKKNTAGFSQTNFIVNKESLTNFTAPELQNIPTDYKGTITYYSSNSNIVEVDEETGKVKINVPESDVANTVFVTAYLPDDGHYAEANCSYTIEYSPECWGKNLVVNGDFSAEITDDAFYKWRPENLSDQEKAYWPTTFYYCCRTTPETEPAEIRHFLAGRSGGITGIQTIDLTTAFTESQLDGSPKVLFSIDHKSEYILAGRKVVLTYLNQNGDSIGTKVVMNDIHEPNYIYLQPWLTLQVSDVLPVGTRRVKVYIFADGTNDSGDTSSHRRGPRFTNVSLMLQPNNYELKTHKITVKTNQELKNEKTFGSGEYWEGSTVFIGTTHEMTKTWWKWSGGCHECDNEFYGYADDTDASITMRAVTVDTDSTFTVNFRKPNPTVWDNDTIWIEYQNQEQFKNYPWFDNEPDDYSGTVRFSSSNPNLATIDEWGDIKYEGKVTPTYKGNVMGGVGTVTITATLPATDIYKAKKISYVIEYYSHYGRNLVKNGDFSSNTYLEHWNYKDEEYAWYRAFLWPPFDVAGYYAVSGWADTEDNPLSQTISLVKPAEADEPAEAAETNSTGKPSEFYYTDKELDAYPEAFFSLDMKHTCGYEMLKVYLEWKGADGSTIQTDSIVNRPQGKYLAYDNWYTTQRQLKVPKGARQVTINLKGRGTQPTPIILSEKWMYTYRWVGPAFDNVSLMLHPKDTKFEECTITTTTNMTDGSEQSFGGGSFWKGSTVRISTSHAPEGTYSQTQMGAGNHVCENQFSGWDYEQDKNPDLESTVREVIVEENKKYEALFKEKYTPHVFLDVASYGICTSDNNGKVPTIDLKNSIKGLPQGYEGTFTYECNKPDLATVDENGIVTYNKTKGNQGVAIVYVTIPAWGDSLKQATKLECLICYAKDKFTINSSSDWTKFRQQYYNSWVIADLNCNLTFGDLEWMQVFKGYFDGKGHTFKIFYEDVGVLGDYGVFTYAEGIIKNAEIVGRIKCTDESHRYYGPLVVEAWQREPTGYTDLLIEGCHSRINYSTDDWDANYVGGFVGHNWQTNVVFKDCAFTGTLSSDDCGFVGGFIGYQGKNSSSTFINCFSDIDGTECSPMVSTDYPAYFVGNPYAYDNTKVSQTNCYAYNYSNDDCRYARNNIGATLVTKRQVKSGEVTYRLNNGRAGDNIAFAQTIRTDMTPELHVIKPKSKEVFKGWGEKTSTTTKGWTSFIYPAYIDAKNNWDPKIKAYRAKAVLKKNNAYYLSLERDTADLEDRTPYLLCTLDDPTANATVDPIELVLPVYYYNKPLDADTLKPLIGVYREIYAPNGSYIMQSHNDQRPMFYRVDQSVAQPKVGIYRCYLQFEEKDVANEAAKIYIVFVDDEEGTPTGIDPTEAAVNRLTDDGPVYDTLGRRVKTLQPNQVYIKNGQKFMVGE